MHESERGYAKKTCYESFSLFNKHLYLVVGSLMPARQHSIIFSESMFSFCCCLELRFSISHVQLRTRCVHMPKEAAIFFLRSLIDSIIIDCTDTCFGMRLLPKLKLICIVLKKCDGGGNGAINENKRIKNQLRSHIYGHITYNLWVSNETIFQMALLLNWDRDIWVYVG